MPCSTIRIGGMTAIVCSRGKRREPKRCCVCKAPAHYECDWKLPSGGTCDKPLCERHSVQPKIGKDLCAEHAADWECHPANRQAGLFA